MSNILPRRTVERYVDDLYRTETQAGRLLAHDAAQRAEIERLQKALTTISQTLTKQIAERTIQMQSLDAQQFNEVQALISAARSGTHG